MAWKSATFRKPSEPADQRRSEAITRAVDKHKDAMADVVRKAQQLAADRRRALNSIQDPELKRSAAR